MFRNQKINSDAGFGNSDSCSRTYEQPKRVFTYFEQIEAVVRSKAVVFMKYIILMGKRELVALLKLFS